MATPTAWLAKCAPTHTESVKKTIFRAEYVECGPSAVLVAAVPGGTEGASSSNDSVGGHTRPQQLRKMPSFDFKLSLTLGPAEGTWDGAGDARERVADQ